MKTKILSLCLISWLAVGCSNQWREADSKVTAEEMMSMLSEISSAQSSGTSTGDLASALSLKDQEGVRIYFAQSNGPKSPLGPVASILSFEDFSFLGRSDLTKYTISETRVFFFDIPNGDTSTNGLVIGYRAAADQQMTYAAFTGTGTMSEGEFAITLQSQSGGSFTLRTFDLTDGDLSAVIQMHMWTTDGAGGEHYNGKFSTLVGFGD